MPKNLFKPGNPGRRPGSRNKSLTRSMIAEILNDPVTRTKFTNELQKLSGRAYVDALIKLFEYDTPKYQSIAMSLSNMSEQDLEFLVNHIKTQIHEESNN